LTKTANVGDGDGYSDGYNDGYNDGDSAFFVYNFFYG
jgi:hypothetical protein